ncbi:putative enoyl-CoA dehydratase/isomerase [Acrocarpospora pleiomorpha]|uniref:Putative enoyl-CoA dehydratase/isomerase n=1 Tax=Acrocarpospora pleiomorpha TaxID=90975 RepID=A0A5M3Y1Z7_9ACTN|nr:enoyl-CoA hydratase/isomerase family protein [Acrocarpospora pleiomorpha]GES25791.1 putative enoyl-CoA dehydratase/isomerase [Acrocarpospora pleiomorpha]
MTSPENDEASQGARLVTFEAIDDVGRITIANPRYRNAISSVVSAGIWDAFESAEGDDRVKAVVIRGVDDSFCAGADLREVRKPAARSATSDKRRRGLVPYLGWTFTLSKPLIGAVNGPAYGAGFMLVQNCDLVVASPRARFAVPEVRCGLSGAWASALPRWLPPRVAMELLLTGEPLTAQRAYELGMINRLVPPDRVDDEALELARAIARFRPANVRASRDLVRHSVEADLDALLNAGYELFRPVRDEQRAARAEHDKWKAGESGAQG